VVELRGIQILLAGDRLWTRDRRRSIDVFAEPRSARAFNTLALAEASLARALCTSASSLLVSSSARISPDLTGLL
jgi:hypothetical protein